MGANAPQSHFLKGECNEVADLGRPASASTSGFAALLFLEWLCCTPFFGVALLVWAVLALFN
jgi:hypothetical protein